MDASVAALLGALIGAGAGVAGQLVAASYSSRNERRRLAVESGLREWEHMWEQARASGRAAEMFPAVLFVHFNNELLRFIDSKDGLTTDNYRKLAQRRDEIRDLIRADTERRRGEEAERRGR